MNETATRLDSEVNSTGPDKQQQQITRTPLRPRYPPDGIRHFRDRRGCVDIAMPIVSPNNIRIEPKTYQDETHAIEPGNGVAPLRPERRTNYDTCALNDLEPAINHRDSLSAGRCQASAAHLES